MISKGLIIAVALVYAFIAADSAWRGSWPMSVVYAGYAFSNIGLWFMAT